MNWVDTTALGSPGFVQTRLMTDGPSWRADFRCLAEIELHERVYYVSFPGTRYVEYIRCKSLEEAKAVATTTARFNQADQLTN